METDNNSNKSEKTEERFGTYFLIFRISGISILPHTYPNIYMLYGTCFGLCAHINVLAMILDVLQHTDDLQYCMDGVQAIAAMITALWIRLFIRYCRTNISKSLSIGYSSYFAFKHWGISLSVCPTAFRKWEVVCNNIFTLRGLLYRT